MILAEFYRRYKGWYFGTVFIKNSEKIPFYQFSSLEPCADVVAHAVFTRASGDVRVMPNRAAMQLFFEEQFLNGRRTVMISANQTHSDHVLVLRQGDALPVVTEVDDTDAFVTNRRDVTLLVKTADCQSVLLFDPGARSSGADSSGVLGLVHSGWRGSLQNIVGKTVAAMCGEFGADPGRIVACIGPSIGPCCHEFTDPVSELPPEFHPYILEYGRHVNFLAATRDQLVARGVRLPAIEFSGVCTCDRTDEFYSFRKDRLTGRFGMMVGFQKLLG